MKRSRHLVAGLLDSGFAALGTFLAGILAVRGLDVRLLAAYTVIAAAAVFAMPLVRQLVYIPSQIAANVLIEVRVPVMRRELRRALPHDAVAAGVVALVGTTLIAGAEPVGVVLLTLTASAMAVISPLQDHLRSCLHLTGRHLRASICSATLAVVVGATVLAVPLLPHTQTALAAAPFGALATANLISAALGLVLLRGVPRMAAYRPSPVEERARFLLGELAVQGAALAGSYLILLIVGAAAVAALEAARVAAAPVFVLAGGLSTFIAPALLRHLSPEHSDRLGAMRELAVAAVLLGVGGAMWIVVLAFSGREAALVLNKPFDLGLTALRAVAASAEAMGSLVSLALLALRRARDTLRCSLIASVIGIGGTALLAAPLGAAALPAAQTIGMATRFMLSVRVAARATNRSERVRA